MLARAELADTEMETVMTRNGDYVREHFLSRQQVLDCSSCTPDELDLLLRFSAIPRPSYFRGDDGRLRSNLGCADESIDQDYFHPTVVRAVVEALRLLAANADAATIARCAWSRFDALFSEHVRALRNMGLVEPAVWGSRFADRHVLAETSAIECSHWLEGTYGLCTRENTPEAIAIKECMLANINYLTRATPPDHLQESARERLQRYLSLFDAVTAEFAPFERAHSSRTRLCEELATRYGLAV